MLISFLPTDISESDAVQDALNSGDRADQRSGRLQNLLPHTAYRFRVRAVNGFGRGNEASQPSGKRRIFFSDFVESLRKHCCLIDNTLSYIYLGVI